MIDVTFEREAQKLTVRGHAESAEAGKDLVCAGASTLVFTLADTLASLAGDGFSPITRLEPGHAEFRVDVRDGMASLAAIAAMFTVLNGFRRLAAEEPDFVKLTEK